MASINLDVYKKSYMLEFVENGEVTDVFTFSVPPENEQFDFAQRVVETKTFGGSVFENFGNDAVHITLSGSTGNGEAKLIYRGTKLTPLYLTGENEIWHLQQKLQEWHDASVLTGTEERKIYLYDLSKMSALEIAAMSPSGRNWWRVIVKSFQIKRQVSKPIYYTYTLELVGLIEESHAEESFLKSLSDTVNDIAETIDTVNNYIQGAADALSLVTEAVETVQDIYGQFSSISDATSDSDKTKAFLLAFSSGVDTVNRAVNVNTNASFYSSTQSTLSAADSLSETIKEFAEEVYDDITDDDDDEEESTTSSSSTSTSSSTDSSDSTDSTDDTTDTSGSDTDGDTSGDTTDDTGSTGDGDTSDSGDDSTGGDSTDDTSDTGSTGGTDTDGDTDGGSTGDDTDTDSTGSGDGSTDDDTSGGDTTTDTDGDDTTGSGDDDTDTDGTGDDTTGGTSTIADGTYTASYTGSGDELGVVSVTIESGVAQAVSVDDTACIQYGEGWVFANDTATYLVTLDISTSSVSYSYTIEDTTTE